MRGMSQLFLDIVAVVDGVRVFVARSGTALARAPTEETASAKRTVSCVRQALSIFAV